MAEDPDDAGIDAALSSVAAHGMLNSVAVARATLTTLRLHWARFDPQAREQLLLRAEAHLVFLGDLLGDLVRGIPAEARDALDALPQTDLD
jgi:hypothetical protein